VRDNPACADRSSPDEPALHLTDPHDYEDALPVRGPHDDARTDYMHAKPSPVTMITDISGVFGRAGHQLPHQ
jgi:hypothetical protein